MYIHMYAYMPVLHTYIYRLQINVHIYIYAETERERERERESIPHLSPPYVVRAWSANDFTFSLQGPMYPNRESIPESQR